MSLEVPTNLAARTTRATHGMNWKTIDGKLSIDTLRFAPERTLDSIHARLKGIKGRVITRDDYDGSKLHLEGIDADRARFIVKIEQRGGEKRGLSVVYSTDGGANLSDIAHRIAGSMQAFEAEATGETAAVVAPDATGATGVDASAAGSCQDGLRWRAVSRGSGQGLAQLESCGAQSPTLPIQFRCTPGSDRVEVTVPMVQTLPRSVRGPFPVSLYAQGADMQTPDGARIPDQTRQFQAMRKDGPGNGTLAFEIAESDPLLKALALGDTGYVSIIARSLGFHLEGAGQALSGMRAACGLDGPTTTSPTANDNGQISQRPQRAMPNLGRIVALHPTSLGTQRGCQQGLAQLRDNLRSLKIEMPAHETHYVGDPIKLRVSGVPSGLAEKPLPALFLLKPDDIDATGDFLERWHGQKFDPASKFNVLPASVNAPGVLLTLSGRKAPFQSEIYIRATKPGTIPLSFVLATFKSYGGPGGTCEPHTLAVSNPISITVVERPPQARLPAPLTCHLQEHRPTASTGDIDIQAVRSGRRDLQIGEAVALRWSSQVRINPSCRTPLYLVVSVPRKTRFEGAGFLAVPQGQEGPHGIRHAIETNRLFFPLHLLDATFGEFKIKSYEAGALSVDWFLAEVPRLVANPGERSDFAVGHEVIRLGSKLGALANYRPGSPQVVVRDKTALDIPDKLIRANSGEFDLHVFKTFYRVFDVATGDMLVERAGIAPNFSPGSRFVAAFVEGGLSRHELSDMPRPNLEVVDIYSGSVVTSSKPLFLSWAFGDTLMLPAEAPCLGNSCSAHLPLRQALLDGPPIILTEQTDTYKSLPECVSDLDQHRRWLNCLKRWALENRWLAQFF